MNYKTFSGIVVLSVILAGCAAALYTPTVSNVTGDVTLAELTNGRALYVSKCGSCHTLKLPSEYSADVWKKNLDEMQERAKISNNEKSDIFKYLRADAKREANASSR